MPLIDLTVEELFAYKGASPCPADFDSFWDQALADLAATDPRVEWVAADFQVPYAECLHMYFTGVGGARIHAKLVRPRPVARDPMPAIAMFHGYSASSGDWFDKLPYAAAGFTVAAMDCRGQGGRSEDPGGVAGTTLRGHIIRGLDGGPGQLYYRNVFLDTAQLARLLMEMPQVDASRVGACGGSQGGGLTLACAALEPRLNRIFSVFPFLSDYKRVWDMDLDQRAYQELREYFMKFDPRHEREEEVFNRLGYIDIQNLAKRIRCTVHMVTGLMDEVCPASTQFAAYNKITSEKDVTLYPDFGHGGLPPDVHDRMLRFMLDMLSGHPSPGSTP